MGAPVISWNDTADALRTLRRAYIFTERDHIAFVGECSISSLPLNAIRIDSKDKIICPGSVDRRHHLWQTASKTTESMDFLAT